MTNRTTWNGPSWRFGAATLALVAGSVGACSDEASEPPPPSVTFSPNPVSFGRVSVVEERAIDIVVENNGGRPYLVTSDLKGGNDDDLFEVQTLPEALTLPPGLAVGSTATITVTFRPCPAAIASPADARDLDCPLDTRTALLTLVDNTQVGNTELNLQGVSTLPPNLSLRCGRVCGDLDNLGMCTSLPFGTENDPPGVEVGDSCALPVEVVNADEGDDPVADVRIENLDITVQELAESFRTISGEEAGFEILTLEGEPLAPSFSNPLEVAIPAGSTEASQRFQIVFAPRTAATYNGQPTNGGGLQITYNDPVEPELLTNIIADATGARFEVVSVSGVPANTRFEDGQTVQFRGVIAGESEDWILRFANNGNANMELGPITFEDPDDPATDEFTLAYDTPEDPGDVVPLEVGVGGDDERELTITYAPTDEVPDAVTLLVECDIPACEPAFRVNITGGSFPQLDLDPGSITFSSRGSEAACRELTLSNAEGDAELVVDQFSIAQTGTNEESLDDFFVDLPECGPDVRTCDVDVRVSAEDERVVDVCYQNNDTSTNDSANLRVRSNDPSAVDGFRTAALSAEDEPCFPPVVGVDLPSRLEAGTAAILDLGQTALNPGGLGGSGGTLAECTINLLAGGDMQFTPQKVTADDDWRSSILAATSGSRVIEIECLNTCGESASAREVLQIAE